jgi:peptidoglycan/xylan/chitin deacetylase (PgdA/CDA1 family)
MCGIDTNISLGDWRTPRRKAGLLCTLFKKGLKPGTLVLLHENKAHAETIKALPCMLDYAAEQGYQVLSLRDFLALAQQGKATIAYRGWSGPGRIQVT